jgi:hypothetical protein
MKGIGCLLTLVSCLVLGGCIQSSHELMPSTGGVALSSDAKKIVCTSAKDQSVKTYAVESKRNDQGLYVYTFTEEGDSSGEDVVFHAVGNGRYIMVSQQLFSYGFQFVDLSDYSEFKELGFTPEYLRSTAAEKGISVEPSGEDFDLKGDEDKQKELLSSLATDTEHAQVVTTCVEKEETTADPTSP